MSSSAYVHRHAVRVGYIDTDRANVVHHAAYLRWLEHARVEYLRERGLDYRLLELDAAMGLPVVDARLKYRLPARFDDELLVETRVGRLSRATVRFDYLVLRGGERLVDAEITLACVRLPEGKLMSLPDVVRRACA